MQLHSLQILHYVQMSICLRESSSGQRCTADWHATSALPLLLKRSMTGSEAGAPVPDTLSVSFEEFSAWMKQQR